MTVLIALWANPLARKIILITAAALALLGMWYAAKEHYKFQGRDEGQQIGHSDAASDGQKALAQQQKSVDDLKAELLPQIQNARDRAKNAETAAGMKDEVIRSLVQQRQNASQQVQGMTEAQVAALVAKYTPRDLADCVATRPDLLKQVAAQDGKINDLANAIAEEKRGNLATVTLYNQEVELRIRYAQEYTSLFNWQSPKYRSWKCAWLKHCGRKLIPFPPPETLLKPVN